MGSKGVEMSSKYGSLDPASNSINTNVDIKTSKTPPKPAVRQKIQQQQQAPNNNNQNNNNNKIASTSDSLESSPMKRLDEAQNKDASLPKSQKEGEIDITHELNKCLADANATNSNQSIRKGGILSLPLDPEPIVVRKYPKKVFFIVANEFCERFSYYGLRTVLVLYFKSVLGFSDSSSTVSFHLFATLCYLTPILGAILGDSVLGKFKTIVYLSVVYFLGEFILVISSVIWDSGTVSAMATFVGLLLIGLGTGGIKPCVSALGGDQFLPHEEKWRQTFFSLFYGAINLGSLISMFLTPMLRSEFHCVRRSDCYPLAFGLPCALMLVSIVVFLVAKNQYVLVPLPKQNVIVAFCQCVWLAFKRKLTGYKLNSSQMQANLPMTRASSDNSSSSNLSMSSNEDSIPNKIHLRITKEHPTPSTEILCKPMIDDNSAPNRNHWLYLASDQFDDKSIEEFRSVLGILLLFVPIPVYWCLFDQQGSLWTLQATRMDGRVFNTGFVLQPDQVSVANPLLLLAAIPVFEVFIYPCMRSCNLLTKPIQRMTVGGMLAALTFVLSALIEIRIQEFLPRTEPAVGEANLLFVNGLSDCSIINPKISLLLESGIGGSSGLENSINLTSRTFKALGPLEAQSVDIPSADVGSYQLKFQLNGSIQSSPGSTSIGCPFDSKIEHNLQVAPMQDKSVKLLYLEQGNGKLAYKLFDESMKLPQAGKARVRMIYESFGSSVQSDGRKFLLVRFSSTENSQNSGNNSSVAKLQFKTQTKEGQVSISDYLDVDVSATGDTFVLRSSDQLIGPQNGNLEILLKPGSRNLIVVHQKDATNVEIKHQLLQDNDYRISILYQLGPYLLISISEVMFSITGLEFSYSMAPDNMKSVILGAWSLTTAFGNILTVAVESMHLFSNIANDFLFYALIMALDMIIFALIGFKYKPYAA